MDYKLSEIAAICGGSFSGCDVRVQSVVTDSRSLSCELGYCPVFVAMLGANHDSHDFIARMQERGVRAFLVEKEQEQKENCGFVVVDNAIDALQKLAAHWRAQFKGRVVAITGSNGKTVIKEWIVEEISERVKIFRSPKSYNSQLGVPLSILMLEGDEDLAIFEAGISKPKEMERLERIIRPDMVIFTSIGDAHQENFTDMEQKCLEKMILAKNASKIIYHSYYQPLGKLIARHFAAQNPFDAASIPEVGEEVIANAAWRRNAQIVTAFCSMMGYPLPSFAVVPSVTMRLEREEGINDSLIINDAYNLDLNSLAPALDYLHSVAPARPKTLVLSDISQSGLSDEELYARVADMIERAGIDYLVGVGVRIKRYAALFGCEKEFYNSTDEAIERISRRAVAGRAVLLKGARDFRFEKLAHALSRRSHTTTLEVDLDAMIDNLNYFRKLCKGSNIMAMVKANSYGAGSYEVAQMLQHQGVDYLAVAYTDEGVALRERGIAMPIVVLNADADSFDVMIANRLEPEIYSFHSLEAFVGAVTRAGESRYPVHIKLDVGMHRLGFVSDEIASLCGILKTLPQIKVASVFSHLNCADMPEKDDYTRLQIALFERLSGQITASLNYPILRHLANSASIERFAEAHFDMCRPGLGLYGFGWRHNEALRPILTLKTRIVQIKHLPKGETVGYGGAGKLMRDTVLATIPVGYADGLDRHLGCGRWSMSVAAESAPIVGRICMDSCMIDITDIEGVNEGDEVIVFSPAKGSDLEAMAKVLDTIPYEIMTSISARVKHIYINA